MSYEYSSKISEKINIHDFIQAINNGEIFSAKCLFYENNKAKIGFKFNSISSHSWSEDAVLEIDSNCIYLIIDAGNKEQRQRLISRIEDELKNYGLSEMLEEL